MDENSLSIEETNKLRISLGLKPLDIGDAEGTATQSKAQPSTSSSAPIYVEPILPTLDRDRLAERQKKLSSLDKAKPFESKILKGRGLAAAEDDDEDDGSALSWIQKHSVKSKSSISHGKSTHSVEVKESRSDDSSQLVGVKIGHDLDTLEGQILGDTILVLEDQSVLDNNFDNDDDYSGNVLVNLEMKQDAQRKRLLDSKKQKSAFDPGDGSILSQYDENDEKGFTISDPMNLKSGRGVGNFERPDDGRKYESLAGDKADLEMTVDYLTRAEEAELVSFKKPKKKSKSYGGKKLKNTSDFNDIPIQQDIEISSIGKRSEKRALVGENLIDDDDLQLALAKTRKKALKTFSPSDVATSMMEEKSQSIGDTSGKGLVLSETSEFVRNLVVPSEPATTTSKVTEKTDNLQDHTIETTITRDDMNVDRDAVIESAEDGEDLVMEESAPTTDLESKLSDPVIEQIVEEPLVDNGIAATLALLRQKGVVKPKSAEELAEERRIEERQKWLTKRYAELMSGKTTNEMSERDEIQAELDRFKDYKPLINLDQVDEFGRTLSQKEIWKNLCHRFHGNKPGKANTERYYRRIAKELKEKRLGHSGDSAVQSNLFSSLQEVQRENQMSHIVLSVGAKNLPPSSLTGNSSVDADDDIFTDLNSSSSQPTHQSVVVSATALKPTSIIKKTAAKKPLHLPQSQVPRSSSIQPIPSINANVAQEALKQQSQIAQPAEREQPKFKPVASTTPLSSATSEAVSSNRPRIQFGLNSTRKK